MPAHDIEGWRATGAHNRFARELEEEENELETEKRELRKSEVRTVERSRT
jgi:hypothetical protein